jgi:hypothetical protein
MAGTAQQLIEELTRAEELARGAGRRDYLIFLILVIGSFLFSFFSGIIGILPTRRIPGWTAGLLAFAASGMIALNTILHLDAKADWFDRKMYAMQALRWELQYGGMPIADVAKTAGELNMNMEVTFPKAAPGATPDPSQKPGPVAKP